MKAGSVGAIGGAEGSGAVSPISPTACGRLIRCSVPSVGTDQRAALGCEVNPRHSLAPSCFASGTVAGQLVTDWMRSVRVDRSGRIERA